MKYSDDELIKHLKELYNQLVRTPGKRDLKKYSYEAYKKHFGNWNNALVKAGIPVKRYFYSDEEILDWIINFYSQHGYSPSISDFIQVFKDSKIFRNRWGTWSNTLKQAGVSVRKPYQKLTNEEMLDRLAEACRLLGRMPKRLEFAKFGLPAPDTYIKRFNVRHLSDVLKLAGIDNVFAFKRDIEKEKLIAELKEVAVLLGHVPSAPELDRIAKQSLYPTSSSYRKVFGSWNNALVAAGFSPRLVPGHVSKEYIIETAKNVYNAYGTISYRLMKEYGISQNQIETKLGGISELKKMFNLPYKKPKYDKKDCIDGIIKVYERIGKLPSKSVYVFYKGSPSLNTIMRVFGSWKRALEEVEKFISKT